MRLPAPGAARRRPVVPVISPRSFQLGRCAFTHAGMAPALSLLQLARRLNREEYKNMDVRQRTIPILLSACVLMLYSAPAADKKAQDHEINTITGPGILWRYPTDIAS